jgi:hypothetical protein
LLKFFYKFSFPFFPVLPSAPEIEGDVDPYHRIGDKVRLTCRSDGGNPLPDITWLKNGVPLQEELKSEF